LCTKSKRDWDPTTLRKELSQLESDPAPTDNLHLRGRKVFPQNSDEFDHGLTTGLIFHF